jgi:hypothetical protein
MANACKRNVRPLVVKQGNGKSPKFTDDVPFGMPVYEVISNYHV